MTLGGVLCDSGARPVASVGDWTIAAYENLAKVSYLERERHKHFRVDRLFHTLVEFVTDYPDDQERAVSACVTSCGGCATNICGARRGMNGCGVTLTHWTRSSPTMD